MRKSRAHSRDSTTPDAGRYIRVGGGGHCLDALVCAAKHGSAKAVRLVRVERDLAHVPPNGESDGKDAKKDDQGGHGSGLCFGALGGARHEQVRVRHSHMRRNAPRQPVLNPLNSKTEPFGNLGRATERLNEGPVVCERCVFHAHIKHRVYGNVNTMFYTFCL